MELPIRVSVQLIQAMPDKRATDTIAYIKSATVAALLLTASDDRKMKLLRQF